MATTTTTNQPAADERVLHQGRLRKWLTRPEMGALGGVILVWIVLAITGSSGFGQGFLSLRGTVTYLEVSAQLGILALAVSLLMIGGEFDLSIGSLIGATGMVTAILASEAGWSIWPAMGVSLILALATGVVNGILVVRTKLPSFIITLATLFIFRGATIGLTRLITDRTVVGGLNNLTGFKSAQVLFGSGIRAFDAGGPISITTEPALVGSSLSIAVIWWLGLAVLATWVLVRTHVGNWIFGIGGDANAARNVGVPVDRMKIALFMTTAFAAWLVAQIQIMDVRSADVTRGELKEFEAIIAVVIGGTLLTGGYGSAVGAVLGALIFGMVKQGIFFTPLDSDWFRVPVGMMLIIAVLVNNYVRQRASESK